VILLREKHSAAEVRTPEMARLLRRRFGRFLDDQEVEAALSEGFQPFRRRVCERILSDPASTSQLNRCPSCRKIVRTPKAQQCFWCGHDWHGESVERQENSPCP
jgi:hypothetical protein